MFGIGIIILFILKLRFKNQPIIECISSRYGCEGVSTFRKCEKIDLKLRKLDCDLDFLVTLVPEVFEFQDFVEQFPTRSRLFRLSK